MVVKSRCLILLLCTALKDYWGGVYSHKNIDLDAANKLLRLYQSRNAHLFDFSTLELPSADFYASYISKLKDSATGRNGIPYSAYKADTCLSSLVFSTHTQYMASESCPDRLAAFNEQLVWFAFKGVCDEDDIAAYRHPSQLRTIFGSNTDSKIVAGGIAGCLTPATLTLTPSNQRGFCKGRQLGLNIVDLDSYMRTYNVLHTWPNLHTLVSDSSYLRNIPCSALYDFYNAFPTLLHQWLFLVLKVLQVPQSFQLVIWWMYQQVTAFSSGVGDGTLLFSILGGVKTGCPASSILFLLGINPIVDMFNMLCDTPALATTRVCADDFGSTLKHMFLLSRQAAIFKIAAKACGLLLKHVKCVIIISGCDLTDDLVTAVKQWLCTHIPEFSNFKICSSGKYLG